jgi:UDP-N-acetylmuramoyl-L-alanyl-D-glutamate--2,6-diaminopimelate ligase
MKLAELLAGIEVLTPYDPSLDVDTIAIHPESVMPGALFVKCTYRWLPATTISAAVRKGAAAVMIDCEDAEAQREPAPGVSRLEVRDVHRAYAALAANRYANDHRRMALFGVTGTKGKTTAAHLLQGALQRSGISTGMLSSLVRLWPAGHVASDNTTPEPLRLHYFLQHMAEHGATHAVLEASSIGIAEDRLHGLRFGGLIFTNFGSDHFEYHGGRDAYLAAKRKLFTDPALHAPDCVAVINTDDPAGRELASAATTRVITYGLSSGDVSADGFTCTESGIVLRADGQELYSPLLGRHNVSNLLAVFALLRDVLGSSEAAGAALQETRGVPGRLERLRSPIGVDVYVDYAHTPESVEAVLHTVTSFAGSRKRVALVGCSSNSDKRKRPAIARAAYDGSDVCILTSDNPGNEHPGSILRDMLRGVRVGADEADRLRVIVDRADAISAAIEAALPDGIVVLMGKGTETVQLIQGQRVPFNDAFLARRVLQQLGERSAAL